MTEQWRPATASSPMLERPQPSDLADILERVLNTGIVVAGDIRVNLLDIELLTIRLRLLIASVDRAREMGIDWWEHDPTLSSGARDLVAENRRLRERIGELQGEGPLAAAGADEETMRAGAAQPGGRQRRGSGRPGTQGRTRSARHGSDE
jgi:hypothetical protein